MNFKKTLDEQGSAANEATGEVVYGIFRNVDATTSDVGDTTCLAITTPNRPGLDVDQCGSSGATVDTVVGIWTEAVAQSKNGLVQLYGYCPKVLMGLSSVVAGDSLKAVSGQDYCAPLIANHSGPGQNADYDLHLAFVVACEANATTTAATKAGFIRAM